MTTLFSGLGGFSQLGPVDQNKPIVDEMYFFSRLLGHVIVDKIHLLDFNIIQSTGASQGDWGMTKCIRSSAALFSQL